jgi:hypothetical protein
MTSATTISAPARPNRLLALVVAIAIAVSFVAGVWAAGIGQSSSTAASAAAQPTFDAVQFRADERDLH